MKKSMYNRARSLIRDDSYYTCTQHPLVSVESIEQLSYGEKPSGLWYARGATWLSYAHANEMTDWLDNYRYVYELELNHKLITNDFTEYAFDVAGMEAAGFMDVDWSRIAHKYAGVWVDLSTYDNDFDRHHTWVKFWDIDSGCIWKNAGVKSIKLITEL